MLLQTAVNHLLQEPHAMINLSLALLLVTIAWFLVVRVQVPFTSHSGVYASCSCCYLCAAGYITHVSTLTLLLLSSCCQ